MSFAAEVPYIVPRKDGLKTLEFYVLNGTLIEIPQFPGLLCQLAGFTPRLTTPNYRIVQLHIGSFHKDDGT